jgi:RHS repeat-associated protein
MHLELSYTTYDALGRITEVGEKAENTSSGQTRFANIFGQITNNLKYDIINQDSLNSWLAAGGRTEVTHTYYDSTAIDSIPMTQGNLRKRISSVTFEDTYDGNAQTYTHATHYSYDIHGNVNTLIQDNPSLRTVKQRYKRIDYDLISGKVNDVFYQHDSLDAFSHRYEYDADNRITEVYTSHYPAVRWTSLQCDPFWDRDAKYFYYAHGPLARVEYGQHHVQGVDYYYTLQGWIKGVNSNILNPKNDGGQDGYNITGNANKNFAKDAYGYTLGYYNGDYSPIDTTKWDNVTKRFEANTSGSSLAAARYDLFNGNITHMVTTITKPTLPYRDSLNFTALPQGTAYKYDQLNRLMEMKAFINITNNAFGTTTYNGSYNNKFTYDENGNILTQYRKDAAGTNINAFTYQRKHDAEGHLQMNRLYTVNDSVPSGRFSDDIDDEGTFHSGTDSLNTANNYAYSAIGEQTKNKQKQIKNITYSVYGKIKEIDRDSGSTKSNLKFDYDAAGERIAKHTYTSANVWIQSEYYVKDAQGNNMSIYTYSVDTNTSTAHFKQTEKNIYGSSRIGSDKTVYELIGATGSTDTSNHYLGNKHFDLTNHLGNVLVTITDLKLPLDTNSNDTIDKYYPQTIAANDYYPFGVAMKERSFNSTEDRYRFNGKQYDSEIDLSDFGARSEDGDVAGWNGLDEKAAKYPSFSPYSFAANNPLIIIDKDGKDIFIVVTNEKTGESELVRANAEYITQTLNSTKSGHELLAEYADNPHKDLYITLGKTASGAFGETDGGVVQIDADGKKTYVTPAAKNQDGVMVYNGNIEDLKGTEVINPDRESHYVVLNEGVFNDEKGLLQGGAKLGAKTLGHELGSHADAPPGSTEEEDHAKWGQGKIYPKVIRNSSGQITFQKMDNGTGKAKILNEEIDKLTKTKKESVTSKEVKNKGNSKTYKVDVK